MDRIQDKREWHLTMVDNAVLYSSQLTTYEKLTYVILCAYANIKTGECYPSIKTLGELAGASKNTVKTSLKGLRDKGLITIQERKKGSLNESNLYTLTKLPDWIVQEYETELASSSSAGDLGRSTDDLGVGQEVTGGRSTDDPELKLINYINSCCCREIHLDSYGTVPNDCQHMQDEQGTVPNTHPQSKNPSNYGPIPNDCTNLDKIISFYATRAGIFEANVSGKDISSAQRMLDKKIPIEFICSGIEHAFKTFKPGYEGDRINSLSYCEKVINKLWANKKAREGKIDGASRSGSRQDRQVSKKFKYTQQPIPEYTDEDLERAGIQ
jgi:DNA-binding transcriptional regulator YhcF (GntR family)